MSADDTPGGDHPFHLEKIRELIGLMEQHGLTEIDLRRGEERWRLRRGPTEVVQMIPASTYATMPAGNPPPMAPPAAPAAGPGEAASTAQDSVPIKSPTVGTFYSAAAPGEEPFVTVGSKVGPETVVCIIEAMKVFNQIPAELNGTVTQVLAKNGDAIEFGQPLFMVRLG